MPRALSVPDENRTTMKIQVQSVCS